MKVVTVGEMRALERKAETFGLSSPVLMQLAGLAVADEVTTAAGGARGRRVVVLVGPGNNGGDGLVAACHLHDRGARITLYLVNRRLDGDQNFALCLLREIESVDAALDPDCERLTTLLMVADVVVDAVLGTGLGRPIMGTIKGALDAVAAVAGDRGRGSGDRGRSCAEGRPPAPVAYAARPIFVAVDIPTGLNADTGEADLACFAADLTVALGFPKVGMFLFPGAANVGTLITRSIGLPDQLAADIKTGLLNANCVRNLLPPRLANANKGTFGKVLVVGGSINYVGAPCLAALAAIRTGAGLVTLATCSSLQPVAAAKLTEATFLPLPEVAGCRALGEAAAAVVGEALADYNTLLIGCGLGRHLETAEFVRAVLRACPPWVNVVVDADGLNALSEKEDWWEDIACPLVLTPHPGEMARLTGHTVGEVNGRRLDLARQFSAKWRKVVVLKGANTVVVSPGGEVNINHAANPALATAGVGDVLAGVIAGLLAQGLSTWDAASAGVYIHGEAGAALSRELGEAGLLASELASAVPRVLKSLRETQLGP